MRQDVQLGQLVEEGYPSIDRKNLKVRLLFNDCIFAVQVSFVILVGKKKLRSYLIQKRSLNLQYLDALWVVSIDAVVEGIAVAAALKAFDELKPRNSVDYSIHQFSFTLNDALWELLDTQVDLIIEPVLYELTADCLASTNASIFLVIGSALAADLDYVVFLVQVNSALLCLDVRVGGHNGVVYGARKRHFVLITEFIVKLQKSCEGDRVIGHHRDFYLHMFLSQWQQLAFDKVDIDLYWLEMCGSLPFADSYSIITVILKDYCCLRFYAKWNNRHKELVAVEFYARQDGCTLQF